MKYFFVIFTALRKWSLNQPKMSLNFLIIYQMIVDVGDMNNSISEIAMKKVNKKQVF